MFTLFPSGLASQLSEAVMTSMVFLCWSKFEAEFLIRTLKFVQLVGSNMVAVSNLAICVNFALVVAVSSVRLTYCCGNSEGTSLGMCGHMVFVQYEAVVL